MNKFIFSVTLVACGWVSAASTFGQIQNRPVGGQPAANPAAGQAFNNRPAVPSGTVSSPVAVIDLLRIFEEHPAFQQDKLHMDRAKEARENELIGQRDGLKKQVEQLKGLKPGTQDYSNLENEIAQKEASLQVSVKKANQEFIMAEGQMYYRTYKSVLDEVKYYASQRGLMLVLRYTGKQINAENPEEIMKEMNEQVVHYNQGIDITNDILNQIRSKHPAAQMSAQPQRPPGPQPTQQRFR